MNNIIDRIQGAYFDRYGEDGHALAYLQANQNVPPLAYPIISKLKELPEFKVIIPRELPNELQWRTTFNWYTSAYALPRSEFSSGR